jgi:hypothetical protein
MALRRIIRLRAMTVTRQERANLASLTGLVVSRGRSRRRNETSPRKSAKKRRLAAVAGATRLTSTSRDSRRFMVSSSAWEAPLCIEMSETKKRTRIEL